MTDKAKLEEIKKLADAMYYAAFNLTTDASLLRKAMEEYHKFIIHEWREEPVSEELEEASKNHAVERFRTTRDEFLAEKCKWSFKTGAQWQKEQFEKNRLAACDKQTEEEAEIERDFVMGIIEKEHRQPAFDDAIKYGMERMKQQMMAKVIDGTARPDDNEIWCNLASFNLEDGDKVKVIVIKEG